MSDLDKCFFEVDIDSIFAKYSGGGKLQSYLKLLTLENKKTNLVSRETSASDLKRLVAESVIPFEKLKLSNIDRYLDIGSGGGLPALPIIVSQDPAEYVLIERRNKKASALRRISLELGLKPTLIEQSFEEVKFDRTFDLITVRLVRLSQGILKKITEVLSPSGVFLYYGSFYSDNCPDELSIASCSYSMENSTSSKSFTFFKKSSK